MKKILYAAAAFMCITAYAAQAQTPDGLNAAGKIYKNDEKAYVEYTIENNSDIDKAVVYIAAYSGGRLSAVGVNSIDKLTSGTYTAEVKLDNSEDIMVKSYLWKDNMEELAAPVVRNYTSPYGSAFEVSQVKLTDGVFKESQDLGKEYIMSLDVDRLLAPVAYSTGYAADTSKYYGGWEAYNYRGYKGKGISGHSLGHWMSAMSTMYAATGDEQIKERLDYAVGELARYQEKDGTGYIGGVQKSGLEAALKGTLKISAFDLNGYWVPWYSFHKIYQGLVDAYNLTGNEQALKVVCGFADWAINATKDMDDDKFEQMLGCEYGGMNETLTQLYEITGEEKYFDLALRFTHKAIINPLCEERDELQGKHANTQIPKVIGAAEIYEADENYASYRTAAEFFYDTVVNHRSYVIGGNSNREHFGTMTEEVLGTQTCESCNTYNMMRLTEHLYAWNHDAKYMDYYEKALFNHILGSQDPLNGEKTYFMATKPGHFKVYSDALNGNSFWCCVGSGMENPGRYTRNIYYKDGNNFYVNQFISSEVTWSEKGLGISQTTSYPYEDTTTVKITKGSANAAINVRIPSWIAAAATVQVNDEEPVSVSETGYYTIEREWSEGDTITVKMPMELHTYTSRDDEHKVSFMYGPVVLAGELGTDSYPTKDNVDDHTVYDSFEAIEVPDVIVKDKSPETFITPTDITKLKFTMNAGNENEISLIPYMDMHHQRYSIYWNLYGEEEQAEKDLFAKELEAATVDAVYPNEQQPEVDHAMQSNNSYSGYFADAARGWRDARGEGGYFSYEMKVSDSDNYVMAIYWGGDGAFSLGGVHYTRDFEIVVDDTVISEQKLNNNSPGQLIYTYYKIPSELTAGKEKVTVMFRTKGAGTAAGGVFEVRTTTAVVEQK